MDGRLDDDIKVLACLRLVVHVNVVTPFNAKNDLQEVADLDMTALMLIGEVHYRTGVWQLQGVEGRGCFRRGG